jgi:hypothetical protein
VNFHCADVESRKPQKTGKAVSAMAP